MSIQPTKLIIIFLALCIICLAGWLMDFSRTVVARGEGVTAVTELQVYIDSPNLFQHFIETNKELTDNRKGVFSTLWHFAAARFHGAVGSLFTRDVAGLSKNIRDCFRAAGWALRYHSLYYVIFFVIKLAVISVAGGAVCRITALQFAQGEKPGLTEAIRFSAKRFASFFTAPLAPLGIIAFMGLFIFLLGLAGNIFKINVAPGQSVAQGDVVMIMEAMKMETEVRAPSGGVVSSVQVKEGDAVQVGDTLLMMG